MGPLLFLLGCHDREDYDGDGFSPPVDCDDRDPQAFPGAREVPYDGVDQDCDGVDLDDQDGDGFDGTAIDGPDCDDLDASIAPGAPDPPYDGVDQDCDGWNDDDADHDGFEAKGHGGDDCDDEDAAITPEDLDGDGFSPCTGDCDEGDPRRNAYAAPICGDDIDEDCDGVSDCALVGVIDVDGLPRFAGSTAVHELGAATAVVGDVDGDGALDLGISAAPLDGGRAVWLLSAQPFPAGADETAAWASFSAITPPTVGPAGDVDGDGLDDLWIAEGTSAADPHVLVFAALAPGPHERSDARLEISGPPDSRVGAGVARIDDRLAIGAPGLSEVELGPADRRGVHPFGDGALIVGTQSFGQAVYAADFDQDGVGDLLVTAPGSSFSFESHAWLISDPPRSGETPIDDLAAPVLDLRTWAPSNLRLTSGDLDGDGTPDPVVSAPFYDTDVGAIAVATGGLSGAIEVGDLPIQRFGLGDDTFGDTVLARDLDGDGQDDLVVGAPAAVGTSGGADKPGAVHVWYGPLEPSIEASFTADLYVQGAYNGYRAQTGAALAMLDGDLDGGVDLLVATPYYDSGVIDLLRGGLTGLEGR